MKNLMYIVMATLLIASCGKKTERDGGTLSETLSCASTGSPVVEDSFKELRDSLKLDSTCIFLPYNKVDPHYDKSIKAIFYKTSGEQDTFYYAVSDKDSIFLWAIVSGTHTRLIRDL